MPNFWETVGLVLGTGGVIVAVQSFLQINFCQPRLWIATDTETTTCEGQAFETLRIKFYNRPLRSKLLRWIGLTRMPIEELMVSIEVADTSGQVIVPDYHANLTNHSNPSTQRIRVIGSKYPVCCYVALADLAAGDVMAATDTKIALTLGRYNVIARIDFHEKVSVERLEFVVRSTNPYLSWDSESAANINMSRAVRGR